MNLFKNHSKTFTISEGDPTYKVKYLGNVLTTFVKGDGCVDRPLSILWNNYLANPSLPKEMQLMVTNSGLKAVTKEQGLMEYRCHRIAYSLHHPHYPKLFIWVYRHEGKKMKVEVRCHAVLCKSELTAKTIYGNLRDRLALALSEFMREKMRRQNSRLILQRSQSVPCGCSVGVSLPLRTQLLRVGQHFKPPSSQSTAAPSLGAISEELGESESIPAAARKTTRSEGKWGIAIGDDLMEEEDDSLFMFTSPESIDCRLADIIPSFFVNGGEDERSSVFESVEDLSPSNRLQSSMNGSAFKSPLTNTLPSIYTESGKDLECGGELFDPKFKACLPYSFSLECDDQSIESGFSEQDAHDL